MFNDDPLCCLSQASLAGSWWHVSDHCDGRVCETVRLTVSIVQAIHWGPQCWKTGTGEEKVLK